MPAAFGLGHIDIVLEGDPSVGGRPARFVGSYRLGAYIGYSDEVSAVRVDGCEVVASAAAADLDAEPRGQVEVPSLLFNRTSVGEDSPGLAGLDVGDPHLGIAGVLRFNPVSHVAVVG